MAREKKDRTGETTIANNGMKMTVVAYRGCYDIDVQFEDGSIRKGIRYSDFKIGSIQHPEKLKQTRNLNRIRVGETSKHKNGMTMTIIAYRRYNDIDVQFEDGAVRRGVSYISFQRGEIRHPKEQERRGNISKNRVGETSIATNGIKMTIIAYRRYNDIDVQFEDGAIRKNVRYNEFKKGRIRHPKEQERRANLCKTRLGETSVATNGMTMTIIAYRSSKDIDVQFEDGTIRKGVEYFCFIKGEIHHPSEKERTGETSVANNGMKMTIIAYRSSKDIDVQFEDGTIRKGVKYQCFIKGEIRHPKEQERRANLYKTRLGETSIASNGMKMTIIAYRSSVDIDVQFEDGAIKKGVRYSCFKRGIIRHPEAWEKLFQNKRIGETSVANNGMKITITAYRRYNDIDVQFEDGAIREHINYKEFENGSTQHPNDLNRVGKTFIASNGMILTVIAYRNTRDVDVQFEDGFIKYGIDYERLKNGGVKNPHFPMRGKGTYNTFQTQYAYTAHDGSVYFYCKCQECGWKKNLTARELINLNHTCENIEGSEI